MAPPAVARVLERTRAAAREHSLFDPGCTVLVACSGGPDSTCLLHALFRLRRLFRIRLAVFHFDHRLRPGSAEDGVYVRRMASRLRLPFVHREAADAPAPGQSVEAWARMARYGGLTQAAVEAGADRVALGHTLDDQAETVLLGLIRGGGLEAVAGMAPLAKLPPMGLTAVRPLLGVTRHEVEAFCRSLRLRPRRDPTNSDTRFLRNRLRLEVLPTMEARLDRGIKATLARTAGHVRTDAAFLESLASEAARGVVSVRGNGVTIDKAVIELPVPVATRVVRQALRVAAAAGGEWGADPGAAHIRGVLDLAAGRRGRRLELPGGLLAHRTAEYVRIARASPERAEVDRLPRRRQPSGRTRSHGRSQRGG
jgi:tRNA(Ile)-lysidine synthase